MSPSLFELPVSRRARMIKLFAVLALDLVLAGAGIAMIVAYMGERERASREPAATTDAGIEATAVEIGTPVVGAEDTSAPSAAEPGPASPSSPPREARTPAPRRETPRSSPTPAPRSADEPAPAPTGDPPAAEPATADDGVLDTDTDTEAVEAAPADADRDARMQLLAHRVAAVVDKNRSQFQRCYRQVAKASGPVQGKVVIRFKVSQDGRATSVRATENETKSERLAECLVAQFGSWSFPTHTEPEPIDFMWPIVFKAPG